MSDHLSASQAERFLRGELPRGEVQAVLRHLLKGCEACFKQLSPLTGFALASEKASEAAPVSGSGSQYDAPISRALAAALSRRPESRGADRGRVERGLDLLRSGSGGLASLTDEVAEDLRGPALVEVLLQLSFEVRYRDPQEMFRLALLAKTAAESLDLERNDPLFAADCQARTWAELGNAHRVNDELALAEAAFEIAGQRLQQGTGNLLLLARVADLYASLLSSQRRLPDACELLGCVHALYLKVGDDHLAGRALISRGICTNYEGEPQAALRLLRQGIELLDRERDPLLVTAATESILEVLVQCGEFREAAEMLLESGLRQALAGEPLNLALLRAVEGQILAGLKKPARAEAALVEARAGLLAHKQGYNAALVGLELAAVWLEQGKDAEVAALAEESLAAFRGLGIQREAVRAMEFLNQACRQQRATPSVVRQVGRFLKQLEREPQLRFVAL